MGSLTSELIVRLIDGISGPAKGAGASLKGFLNIEKQVANQLKNSGSNYNFGKAFSTEIGKLKLSAKELDTVGRDFERFQQRLRASSQKMRASEYVGALDAWKSRTLSNITAVRAASEEAEKARAKLYRGWRGGARMAAGALGVGSAAYAANRTIRGTITAGAGNEREGARDYLAGLSAADSARLKARALGLSAKYPSVDSQSMHQSLRETAMSMRSVDKASDLGDTLAQGLVVLQSLKGKDEAIKESAKFFSALDTLGKNLDGGEVKELFNGYLKALGVEGVDLNLGDLKQISQMSKSAGPGLSNRFLTATAPGLQGDMGAKRLGTALGSEVAQIIGDRATKKAKAAQAEFGLRDENGWKNGRKIMTDPDKYAWEDLIPAIQKKGVDPDDIPAVTKAMNQIFSNQVVSDLFTKMITQRQQYQAKSGQYDLAPGLEAAGPLRGKDPFVSLEGLMAQLRNFASTLAEGPMQKAIPALNSFADAIARLTGQLANNPDLAAAAGLGTGAATAAGGVGLALAARKAYQWFKGSGAATAAAEGVASTAAAEGGASASMLSRFGMLGRLAQVPLWSGARVLDDDYFKRKAFEYKSKAGGNGASGSFDGGASGSFGESDIWKGGAKPVDFLDQSDKAATAGTSTGEAYKTAITAALSGVDALIDAAVQRWTAKLGFNASPTITPKIGDVPGKGASLQGVGAKQQAAHADYGFSTTG